MKKIIIISVLFCFTLLHSQNRILLDEDFSDWENFAPLYSDSENDQTSGIIDFQKVWAANDANYLFFRIQTGGEINLQNNNDITIYIDTDNNSSTGLLANGIGAELEYNFGAKSGTVILSGGSRSVKQFDIGLVTSPTVTSTEFEIGIKTDIDINGISVFANDTIKFLLKENGGGKDVIPNEDGGIEYSFKEFTESPLPSYTLEKENNDFIRFLSYNVLFDNLFESSLREKYSRILQAVEPDIIAFQEIYDHTSQETANLVETFLPSSTNQKWYHSKVEDMITTNNYGTDLIVLSRFPIKQSFHIEGYDRNGNSGDRANFAVLIDLRPKYDTDLLLLNAHPPCCSNDPERQEEVDKMMQFIRNAKNGVGDFTLEKNTPIIIMGDMNFVGFARQRGTFLNGDIFDNAKFGDDFIPDWDSTNFTDLKPYTSNMPMSFTWYVEDNSFSPGRLDYIIYSSSVLKEENSFVLFTPALSLDTLNKYKLEERDVVLASDHLPVVADFSLKNLTNVDSNKKVETPTKFSLLQNYPNPFNPTTTIEYYVTSPSVISNTSKASGDRSQSSNKHEISPSRRNDNTNVTLKIYNIIGRQIKTLVNQSQNTGNYKINFDGSDLASGIYYYKLTYGSFEQVKKMIVLK